LILERSFRWQGKAEPSLRYSPSRAEPSECNEADDITTAAVIARR